MFSLSLFLSPSLVENYNSLTCFLIATRREGANFYFQSVGMRRGDSFVFYHRDVETANTNSGIAFEKLRKLKEKTCANDENMNKNGDTIMVDGVFGGLIFSCRSRGASYFGRPNVGTSPFSLNFPGVPVAGVFCKGEIGRGSSSLITGDEHDQEQSPPHCCIHACSAVYLAMSYVPASPVEH